MDGCGMALCALGSEGARTVLAGAFGGLTRWIASEQRRLKSAVLAVAGGALAGHYLWPMSLWALGMDAAPQAIPMAAFISGTLGISGVRMFGAICESRARRLHDA
ncbi:hypothetical protein [Falsirhodobacter deserti]|uniref:hypothetical protein n=1 Tax=Falsirhodobacter deserti TaxID=1365611 RepID=UPI000FE33865|nr:hypothetical protein [Falsirhodobacter deserti]